MTEQPDSIAVASPARGTEELLRAEIATLRAVITEQDTRIACIQEIATAQGSTLSLDKLLNVIMEKVTVLMHADRSTLFVTEDNSNELWSKVIQGDAVHEIRLRPGQGIAGWVAQTGKSVNIRDAYRDHRFNPDVDVRTGYKTRSILCQPIRNRDREIIGVIQVLNRQDGYFSVVDENLLSALAAQVAVSIENQKLYLRLVSKNLELTEITERLERHLSELDLLYDLQRQISQALDLPSLIEAASRKTLDTIKAQLCVVTLREGEHYREFTVPRGANSVMLAVDRDELTGATRLVFDSGSAVMRNVETDGAVPHEAADAFGVEVRSVLAVPLWSEDTCIGSLALINKNGVARIDEQTLDGDTDVSLSRPNFSDSDMKLLTLMAGQMSGAVAVNLHREEREKEERLASIGQMLSGVIHDFKTPVTIISGYVQLMAAQDDAETRQEYARSVLSQFDQLNKMTKEILAFARGETSILFRRVFLRKLTAELDEVLGRDLGERGIHLSIDNQYGGSAKMDDVKVKRALFNLARNAAEAMPNGGNFSIQIRAEEDRLIFRVSDDGPGIPEEIRGSLFESFVTRGKRDGTGLGLAIVKKIVERHDGTIEVETATDKGTTFILTLPLEQA